MSTAQLPIIGHLIDGQIVTTDSREQAVYNPATGAATARVLLAAPATGGGGH